MTHVQQNLKKSHIVLHILFGIIALSVGIYFRSLHLTNHVQHESSEKAAIYVTNQLRKMVQAQVNAQYPKMPDELKKVVIQKQFDQILRKESKEAISAIERISKEIEEAQSPANSDPYLLASDSYYYYNLTENIKNTGRIAKNVKGSKYLNELMLAPLGHWEPLNLHPYVGLFVYHVVKIFNPGITLMSAVSYTPLFIAACSLIIFILLNMILRLHPVSTFCASFFLLLSPIFIKRSAFGWYDNDPYNILFPFLILTSLFYGLKHNHNQKKTIIFGILTALLILLYAFFWHGWVFIFSIILVSGIFICAYELFVKKGKQLKNTGLYFSIITFLSFFLIGVVLGFREFFILFAEGFVALKNFLSPQLSPWPDLYISVGELKNSSVADILKLTGGQIFIVLSALGLIYLAVHLLKKSKTFLTYPTIITIVFLLASFYITMGAQRFILFTLIPLSILCAFGIQSIIALSDLYLKRFSETLKKPIAIIRILILTMLCLTVSFPIKTIHASWQTYLNPIYNTTWDRALKKLEAQTPENAIINTWWSPGHFIKATAKRRVTFDGATINVPQAYWIANVFLSRNENEAVGLIRMLNNSGNKAVEYLTESGYDLSTSIAMLKEITGKNRNDAKGLLRKAFKNNYQVEHLLDLTHKTPPPSYLLLYNEFAQKNLQLSFVGRWNFKEIDRINQSPSLLKEVPNPNSKEYVSFLWDMIGQPYKFSGLLGSITKQDDTVIFQENIRIDIKYKTILINSKSFGRGVPQSLFFIEEGRFTEKRFPQANLPYSVALIEENGRYSCLLLDRALARSMLVRLFYFKGIGLKHFKPLIEESDLTKRTEVQVYEVLL